MVLINCDTVLFMLSRDLPVLLKCKSDVFFVYMLYILDLRWLYLEQHHCNEIVANNKNNSISISISLTLTALFFLVLNLLELLECGVRSETLKVRYSLYPWCVLYICPLESSLGKRISFNPCQGYRIYRFQICIHLMCIILYLFRRLADP